MIHLFKKLNIVINFFLTNYTILEIFISKITSFFLSKNYIKTSLLISVFFYILSITILYTILLFILCVTICYHLYKKKFKKAFLFFYKYILVRFTILLLIKYINALFILPIYFLYKIIYHMFNNKPSLNITLFIIYVGNFIRLPINKCKEEILFHSNTLQEKD